MKKHMLLAILIATFFSCTEVLDELNTIDPSVTDSLSNIIIGKDSVVKEDSTTVVDSLITQEDSVVTEEPNDSELGNGRFYTKAELEIWKERSQSGLYSQNWGRILKNAETFLANPNAEIWSHNLRPMTQQQSGNNAAKPIYQGYKMRDAAFKYLLTGELKYGNLVRQTLLKQIKEPSTNFADRTYWQPNLGSFAPVFHCAEWALTLLFTYDYTYDLYSADEKAEIEDWFHNAGLFFNEDISNELDKLFVNRQSQNYTLSNYANIMNEKNAPKYTHVGGHPIPVTFAYNYQNRQASAMRLVAYVGFLTNDSKLISSAKNFVKECVMFWAFPDGLATEFERGFEASRPEAGYYYSFTTLEELLSISDVFARNGDFSLYDYETSKGWGGNDGPKSLWKVAKTLCQLKRGDFYDKLTQSNSIYSIAKQPQYKIDGYDPKDLYSGLPIVYAKEILLSQYNIYYKDSYIKESYETCLNTGGTKVASSGPHFNDQGAWGVNASKQLMYSNLEGVDWPFSTK